MPEDFNYRNVFLHGRPRHEKYDDFWRKHPPMDHVHRAKIFAPFDALAGFNECITSKEILYQERRHLSEGEREELDRKLAILKNLTINSKEASRNRPQVTIQYFVHCADENSSAYGRGGTYQSMTGICQKVDGIHRTITVDEEVLQIEDICDISGDLFDALDDDIP